MMKLNVNDRALMHYLHAVKVATYKQIHRDIYPDYCFRSVCNRIVKLSRFGLVTGSQDRLGLVDGKVISVSKKSFTQFVAKGDEQRLELKSESIHHDIELVDIRAVFMKLPQFLEYYTENQIQTLWPTCYDMTKKSLVQLNSDAIALVSFQKGTLWVAVEMETTAKAVARYDPIVKKYYSNPEIPLVLYVCTDEEILNKVMKKEKELYDNEFPKFFYLLKSQIHPTEAVTFSNYNKRLLTFDCIKRNDSAMISQ